MRGVLPHLGLLLTCFCQQNSPQVPVSPILRGVCSLWSSPGSSSPGAKLPARRAFYFPPGSFPSLWLARIVFPWRKTPRKTDFLPFSGGLPSSLLDFGTSANAKLPASACFTYPPGSLLYFIACIIEFLWYEAYLWYGKF